jgi:hypothetical protein
MHVLIAVAGLNTDLISWFICEIWHAEKNNQIIPSTTVISFVSTKVEYQTEENLKWR